MKYRRIFTVQESEEECVRSKWLPHPIPAGNLHQRDQTGFHFLLFPTFILNLFNLQTSRDLFKIKQEESGQIKKQGKADL